MAIDSDSPDSTRQAMLDAFTGLLADTPYADITIAAVATRAGLGRSAFYEHFKTKTDLLRRAFRPLFVVIATAIDAAAPTPELTNALHQMHANFGLARLLATEETRNLLLRSLASADEARLPPATHLPAVLLAAHIATVQFDMLEPWILGTSTLTNDALAETLCRTSHGLANGG